jgi:hypothetical protein
LGLRGDSGKFDIEIIARGPRNNNILLLSPRQTQNMYKYVPVVGKSTRGKPTACPSQGAFASEARE